MPDYPPLLCSSTNKLTYIVFILLIHPMRLLLYLVMYLRTFIYMPMTRYDSTLDPTLLTHSPTTLLHYLPTPYSLTL